MKKKYAELLEKKEVNVDELFINSFVHIVKVILYIMKDYSRKVSVVLRRDYDHNENTFCSYYFKEYLLSNNGQSYEYPIRCMQSKKPAKAEWTGGDKNQYKLRTRTFDWNDVLLNKALELLNIDKVEFNSVGNRFRNLSDRFYIDIVELRHDSKKVRRAISKIDMYADHSEILDIMFKNLDIPRTKAFRKEFFRNPVSLYHAWRNFEGSGIFKDFNSFWKLYKNDKVYGLHDKGFFGAMIKKSNEAIVVNKIINCDNCYQFISDSSYIYHSLVRYFGEDRINNMLTGSLKEIHDRLTAEWNRVPKFDFYGERKSFTELHEEYRELLRMGISKEAAREKRAEIIEYLEYRANRRFRHDCDSKKLEGNLDDISFRLPIDSDDLRDAGSELHNCVGSYASRVRNHETNVIFMEKGERKIGCIEVQNGVVRQAYGPCNQRLEGTAYEAFAEWANDHLLDRSNF